MKESWKPRVDAITAGTLVGPLLEDIDLDGLLESETLRLDGKPIDALVRLGSAKRTVACRLVAVQGPKGYCFYLTNLPAAVKPRQVAELYRVRWEIGVSSKGHIIQSVEVRPGLRDSGPVAWEAPWRVSKTVEPFDNILGKEDAQRTRLQRAVNADVAS